VLPLLVTALLISALAVYLRALTVRRARLLDAMSEHRIGTAGSDYEEDGTWFEPDLPGSGVREPRRPRPTGGAGSVELPQP
jgi:hypothetical protein